MDCDADVMLFSEASREDFGETVVTQQMNVRALSHASGCIHKVKPGKLTDILMKIPHTLEVSTHLNFYTTETELYLCDDYTFLNRTGDRATFRMRFPFPGYYSFKVYARQRGTDGPYPNVFNYVIEVLEAEETVQPFPVPVECYDLEQGFELREPMFRFLPSHSKVVFSLWVSGAQRIFAINKDKIIPLVPDDEGVSWTAEVDTLEAGTQLRINAELQGQSRLPVVLLLYQVIFSGRDVEVQPAQAGACQESNSEVGIKEKENEECLKEQEGKLHKPEDETEDRLKMNFRDFLPWN